jgi:glutamate-1-semialdehyde 2,1-aminomutase
MYAVRLARGYTGKKLVIKAFGGWHGYNPLLNWYHLKPFDEINESKGQIFDLSKYVRGVQFGNIENILNMIRRNRENLACVILEISMTKNREQDRQKIAEYLMSIKEELKKHNALLILDEVVTGFRLAQGGAQEYFGVNADLTTFGKILGGGMPVGAVSGREEILRLANVVDWQAGRKKKSDLVWIGGGTFSGNIMTMIAGIETLKILKKHKAIYDNLEKSGREIRSEFRKIFKEADLPFEVQGIQSAFKPNLDSLSRNTQMEWIIRLLNKGVFGHRPEGYLSSVHTREDVKKNVIAVGSIVEEMKNEFKEIE